MKEQTRAEPRFSLCGLNCGLCPMYHISETEHCTGCGGAGRPSCAVQRCAREHGGVEYCFQCAEYPCARYTRAEPYDSFVPHRNVQRDFARAAHGVTPGPVCSATEKPHIPPHCGAEGTGRKRNF